MSTVGYGISDRVGGAEWNRLLEGRLNELEQMILRDDARVVRAAFFAPLPGSGNPSSTFYHLAFREARDNKLLAFEFHGRHKRLPISVNSTYFEDGRWIFTDQKKTTRKGTGKRKASIAPVKKSSENFVVVVDNDDDDDVDGSEEMADEDKSSVHSLGPMPLLEQWANEEEDIESIQDNSYEDDLSEVVSRNTRRRHSPQSLLSRINLTSSRQTSQRPVDYTTPAPPPSSTGFSASEVNEILDDTISEASSSRTETQGLRRSLRLGSQAPSEISSSETNRNLVGSSKRLQSLELQSNRSEMEIDFNENRFNYQIKMEEDGKDEDDEMDVN